MPPPHVANTAILAQPREAGSRWAPGAEALGDLHEEDGPLLSDRIVTYCQSRDLQGPQSQQLVSADSDSARARCGWQSDFPTFADEKPRVVRIQLQEFLAGASESQVFAWDDSIPKIQVEVGEVVEIDQLADQYTAILEYELPLESRRPDVVLLVSGAVVVLELKGKTEPDQADLDQAAAYARDLRCYHRHCADREVHAVVVPTQAHGYVSVRDGVHVASPDTIHELIQSLQRPWAGGPLKAEDFLSSDAYCCLL